MSLSKNDGLAPDSELETNEHGGKQSKLAYAFHLIDAPAIMNLAEVLQAGAARYDRDNWRHIPMESHLSHALCHIFALLAGDTRDDHLGHAQCRLHFAKALELRPDFRGYADNPMLKKEEGHIDNGNIQSWDGNIAVCGGAGAYTDYYVYPELCGNQ